MSDESVTLVTLGLALVTLVFIINAWRESRRP
jgi:hypothetical protein